MLQPNGAELVEVASVAPWQPKEFLFWFIGCFAIEALLFVLAPRLWPYVQLDWLPKSPNVDPWPNWPWTAFKFVLLVVAGWSVLFRSDLVACFRERARRPSGPLIALHLLCLMLLLAPHPKTHGTNFVPLWATPLGGCLFMAASVGYFLTLMRLSGTQTFWARHHPLRHPVAAVAFGIPVVFTLISSVLSLPRGFQSLLNRQLFDASMALALPVLHSAGFHALVARDASTVSIGDFAVNIAPSCLGYEGWVMAFVLIGGYIFMNRRDLVFPRCLVVFPVVVCVLFVCNSLRIAALLAIGAAGHPDVALGGFHSSMGSVAVFAVTGVAIVLLSYFGRRKTSVVRFEFDIAGSNLQLLPWIVAASLAVASGLVFAGVDWWYPVRVVIVGALLFRWRGRLHLDSPSSWWLGPAAGVAVFVLWLALVPHDAVQSAIFEEKLFASSAAASWIVFRVLGASVIVPIVEELAFRGFLLDRAAKFLEERGWARHTALCAGVAASSLVFGVLHSAWVAGILAGVAYAAVRLYRGRIADAVMAHAVTNLLLSAYVLNTGNWSYW